MDRPAPALHGFQGIRHGTCRFSSGVVPELVGDEKPHPFQQVRFRSGDPQPHIEYSSHDEEV